MKIFITHPAANKIKLNDEQPVNIESINNISNASCTKIQLNNVLDYIMPKDRDKALSIALSKLRIDGEIHLNGIDFFAIGVFISNGLLSLQEVNQNIFNGKLSIDSISLLKNRLSNNGFEIVKASIENFSYNIIAKRKPQHE